MRKGKHRRGGDDVEGSWLQLALASAMVLPFSGRILKRSPTAVLPVSSRAESGASAGCQERQGAGEAGLRLGRSTEQITAVNPICCS
jgi:hypothetical protein